MPSPDARAGQSSVAERYRVLLDTGRTLAGTLSTEELFEAIHRETASVLEASGFYISLYDQGRDLARIVYFADQGKVQRIDVSYRGTDSEVLRTQKATIINQDLGQSSLMILGDEDTDVTRSAISAPMINKGRILGAISAQSYERDTYSEADLALLQGIADIAAVAVDNALVFSELERRRSEAEQIEEIGRALTSELDFKEVLGKVISAVLEVLDVDGAAVWLVDEEDGVETGRVAASGGDIIMPVGLTWPLAGPLRHELMEAVRPIVFEDLAANDLVPEHLREYLEGGSSIGVPLVLGGRVTGVLTGGSRKPRHFSDDDLQVLQRLAGQASVALGNARLLSDLQALSLTDPLTGLPNRRRLQIHLDKEVAAARRGRTLVVVVFDLDDFKTFNDNLGHLVGDDILRAFAQILADENRAMNLVARYGGDEFVSVLSESHMEGAQLYARRVESRVGEDPILAQYGATVSIGLAEFDRASMRSADDVIQAADMDMYSAKAKRHGERRATSTK